MGGERSRERARSWASEEGGSLGLRGGGQQVLEGLQSGDSRHWRGCGGRSALVRSVCIVDSNAGGDLDDWTQG